MAYKNSLNLKSDEAYRLAHVLAEQTGESITKAVVIALQERLERLKQEGGKSRFERLRSITEGARQEWREPYRSIDHSDLLYDERGLPRDC